MKETPLVSMYHVYKTYANGWHALTDVNFSIQRGEFVFLVGPSAAGKTTLLRLIYMEEFPTRGQVVVGDYSSSAVRPRDVWRLRRKLGVIFQDFRLLEDRNVFENVAFALEVTGARRGEVKRRVLQTLTAVGLNHKRNSMPYELSGGEQQRVAIARALVNDPFLLIADEPTGNLDPVASREILELLRDVNAGGTATLVATHDVEKIKHLPYRLVRIQRGRTSE